MWWKTRRSGEGAGSGGSSRAAELDLTERRMEREEKKEAPDMALRRWEKAVCSRDNGTGATDDQVKEAWMKYYNIDD